MKDEIVASLKNIGFTITEKTETFIAGSVSSFNNGTFEIEVQLKDKTFSVRLNERFGSLSIFFYQKFTDANYIISLLEGNYLFQEFIIENKGTVESMFKEFALLNDL